ncbi:MAG: hypothetical protein N3B21_04130 [Clostridia bacterium]|nr:hypothetical protein [Clostridia bacterium]
MDKNKKLEYITNGLNAASKIRDEYHSSLTRGQDNTVSPGTIDMINRLLRILTEYAPETHSNILAKTNSRSNLYINTYRTLKTHLNKTKTEKINKASFVKALTIMKPVLDNNRQAMVDKIVQFYNLFGK